MIKPLLRRLATKSLSRRLAKRGRNLVMTASDSVGQVMLHETIDLMQAYALRIGADFKCLQHENHALHGLPWPHAVKFYCGLELARYDRVLWIDADCLVSPHCPNLFDHVPASYSFAAWCGEPEAFDPYYTFKRPVYNHGYFNSGVLLSSDPRPFARGLEILLESDRRLTDHEKSMAMGEQTPFNKAVHELGIDVFPLEPAWNFLLPPQICSDLGITTTIETAHIVHCAGSSHLEVQDQRCRQTRAAGMRELRQKLGWQRL